VLRGLEALHPGVIRIEATLQYLRELRAPAPAQVSWSRVLRPAFARVFKERQARRSSPSCGLRVESAKRSLATTHMTTEQIWATASSRSTTSSAVQEGDGQTPGVSEQYGLRQARR
jgi:hypothetical protein